MFAFRYLYCLLGRLGRRLFRFGIWDELKVRDEIRFTHSEKLQVVPGRYPRVDSINDDLRNFEIGQISLKNQRGLQSSQCQCHVGSRS